MTIGKKIAGGFAISLFLLLGVGAVAFWSLAKLTDTSQWVTHTHEVLEKLEGVLSLAKDVETGQRGYLLTGEDKFLEPYEKALEPLEASKKLLRKLTED